MEIRSEGLDDVSEVHYAESPDTSVSVSSDIEFTETSELEEGEQDLLTEGLGRVTKKQKMDSGGEEEAEEELQFPDWEDGDGDKSTLSVEGGDNSNLDDHDHDLHNMKGSPSDMCSKGGKIVMASALDVERATICASMALREREEWPHARKECIETSALSYRYNLRQLVAMKYFKPIFQSHGPVPPTVHMN
jgi:hypothetical protein